MASLDFRSTIFPIKKVGYSSTPASFIKLPISSRSSPMATKAAQSIKYSNSGTLVPVHIKWDPPSEQFVKCNSDASWDSNAKKWTAAAVVRGTDGKCIAATALRLTGNGLTLSESDVEFAEIKGVLIGVRLVPSTHIWIETDNLINAKCIKRSLQGKAYDFFTRDFKSKATWQDWKAVIQQLRTELLGKTVIVTHVYREGNKAADMLSRVSNDATSEVVYRRRDPRCTKPLPYPVQKCIEDDRKGKSTVRYLEVGKGKLSV